MKPVLDKVEFYITNVCNFNCDNCNRLNNYFFNGHQLWKDYEDIYAQWAEKIDIETISILGGEPLLNPSLVEWVEGIRRLWPTAPLRVVTNGSRLKYWPELYATFVENQVELTVTAHNRSRYSDLVNEVVGFMQAPVAKKYDGAFLWPNVYNQIRDASWPNCASIDEFDQLPQHIQDECRDVHKIDPDNFLYNTSKMHLQDANGFKVGFDHAENFITAPLRYDGQGTFQVYNSDPIKAHDVCISKHCHHFIRGKLYKCHHVALLPEFMDQFHVNISDQDQKLLAEYQPLTPDSDQIQQFFDQIKQPIPQCKLCPAKLEDYPLESGTNKPKVPKKTIKIQALDH